MSSAYLLKFKFEGGRYALVGRETIDKQTVLRIEYYPTKLFSDDPGTRAEARANQAAGRKSRDEAYGDEMQRLMNKVSRVTIWVEPDQKQIVKYTFENVGLEFLPASWLVRVTELRANMAMTEAFPDVWLPKRIDVAGSFVLAPGPLLGELRHPVLRLPRSRDGRKISRTGQPPTLTCAEPPASRSVLVLLAARVAAQPVPAQSREKWLPPFRCMATRSRLADEIIRASGIAVGDPVSDTLLSDAEARLRSAIKFDSVDVLKRFASISDPTQVLILIQVDEGPVRIDVPDIDVPAPECSRPPPRAESRAPIAVQRDVPPDSRR